MLCKTTISCVTLRHSCKWHQHKTCGITVTDSGCSVYSLFSALIMHVYQMRSSNQSIVTATQGRLTTCMQALKDVSKVWLVAKMVHTLFESILGNKALEERLQKAAGRKHNKNKQHNGASSKKPSIDTPPVDPNDHKRKFDEMEMGYSNGPPAPQMSYERSRPQSPALSPTQNLPAGSQAPDMPGLPNMTASSPVIRHGNDAFMGRSRPHTRPTTPFNGFSYPGTPPDFFLHTRNSPKIAEDVWQNYQPDQLFPPETNQLFPVLSNSPSQQMNVDPSLRGQFAPGPGGNLQSPSGMHSMPMQDGQSVPPPNMGYNPDPAAWAQLHAQSQARPDDQWSNSSSAGGPIVPTTLNVGDWFEFFGIQNAADINGLNGLNGMNGAAQQQQQQGNFG